MAEKFENMDAPPLRGEPKPRKAQAKAPPMVHPEPSEHREEEPSRPAPSAAQLAEETFAPSGLAVEPQLPENPENLQQPPAVVAADPKQKPLPANPNIGEDGLLTSQTFNEEWKIASMMANSEMVPDAFRGKPAAVMMAMQTARSRGLNPLTAIQKTANIYGTTQNFGELPLAEAFDSKRLKFFQEFWINEKGEQIGDFDIKAKVFGCVTIAEAHDSPQGRVIRIFTLEDAKVAGLTEDPKRKPWRQYVKRMLQMRSRGWCLKDCVPEVTAGIKMPEYDDHADEIELPKATNSLQEKLMARIEVKNDGKPKIQN